MITKTIPAEFYRKTLDSFSETMYPYQYDRRNGGRTEGHGDRYPQGRPATRRTMNDVADGLLLDVREISITDLEFADSGSALSQALERILVSRPERSFASFTNFIS
jgi:hypothetical protein